MSKTSCWFLLSLLILFSFVAEIHGVKKQRQVLHKFQKSKLFKANSEVNDRSSHFDTNDHIVHHVKIDSQLGLKDKDKIKKLPGQPHVKFSQYGGYVTVDKLAGRAFYYYFVEAPRSKETLPLLLWLNGGPGCSSFGYGAMQEIGPFRVNSDGKTLHIRRYSWNYAANVLFLESPAGVGFSYSNKSSDYDINGDRKTAADNYVFLVNWLERFAEYKNRDFYIAGESYAGHYIPQIAHKILWHNKRAKKTIINLKGIMIGNAVINSETDTRGVYDFLGSHAIISDQTAQDINDFCDFSVVNQSNNCNHALAKADYDTNFIDAYNIYAPLCHDSSLTTFPKKNSDVFDPCSDDYVHAYLNRGDVQEALHANVTKLNFDWEGCSDIIEWGDSATTIIPLLHEFQNKGLRVWIYSGDIDSVVPVTGTLYSLKKMKLPIETIWQPWFLFGEVGGYTQVYKGGLTFATVREAGHEVPSYQPKRAFSLVKHFLDGTPLPIH
ncbi:hypothetical protein VNO78_12659 [Psophocarpus tetragonolobus]|uniref:Carboxypeptidase n=1 Tax=Psophocarpus tetragonolobus TaxID=3891 RepID=A0AAN9SNN1_PSOTE